MPAVDPVTMACLPVRSMIMTSSPRFQGNKGYGGSEGRQNSNSALPLKVPARATGVGPLNRKPRGAWPGAFRRNSAPGSPRPHYDSFVTGNHSQDGERFGRW